MWSDLVAPANPISALDDVCTKSVLAVAGHYSYSGRACKLSLLYDYPAKFCFAVGILAMHCAFMRGASRVIIIDRAQYRLERAKEVRAAL